MNEYIKNMPAGGVLGNPPLSFKSRSQYLGNQVVDDETSFNNDAILRNGASLTTDNGHSGKAVQLDGADDYVEIQDAFQSDFRVDHTFSFWLKHNAIVDGNQTIFTTLDQNGAGGAWGGSDPDWYIHCWVNGGSTQTGDLNIRWGNSSSEYQFWGVFNLFSIHLVIPILKSPVV